MNKCVFLLLSVITIVNGYNQATTDDLDTQYLESIAQNCNNNFFLVAGGSLAANTGYPFNTASSDNILVWNSELPGWEIASFPLAGGDGTGSSPWLQFGKYVHNHTGKPVCFINIARIGSHIQDWHPAGGIYYSMLTNAYQLMSKYTQNGVILWSQGESDANVKSYSSYYGSYLFDIINNSPSSVSWLVSQTSYSPRNQYDYENNVRRAQSNVVHHSTLDAKIHAGPNTDSLCQQNRYSNFYLTEKGIKLLANGWTNAYDNMSKTFTMGIGHCDVRFTTLSETVLIFIFILSIILITLTCCCGFGYVIKKNNYHTTIYYKLIKTSDEKHPLLKITTTT